MEGKLPKLCLNMIVKNESRIIRRLLNSVKDVIDSYCICDTGSTDNTVALIEEFGRDNSIPGKVIREGFRNFEYNRSFALRACDDIEADYILLLDADMIFWKNPKITGEKFKKLLAIHGAFYIFQGSDAMYYKNTRIVKNRAGFSYKGVTHEYVEVPSIYSQGLIVKDIAFINDIGDGGAKSDKFSRDVHLLKEGLEKNPYNERYMFYLANSLKDLASSQKVQVEMQIEQQRKLAEEWAKQFDKYPEVLSIIETLEKAQQELKLQMVKIEKELKTEAIKYYHNRIKAGGFWEEVWYSYYNIGKLYMDMGEVEKGIYNLQQSFILYPQRVENLYEIVKYYRENGLNHLAVHFYLMARNACETHTSRDYLFIQRDIYDYRLDYEMSIIGYYTNPTNIDMAKLCLQVLSHKGGEHHSVNIMSNYKFYADNLSKYETKTCEEGNWAKILSSLGGTLDIPSSDKYPDFLSSTPSFCKQKDGYFGLVRYVDYKVNDKGGYEQKDFIQTKNVVGRITKNTRTKEWVLEKEGFLAYNSSLDNIYVGLEDMRLFSHAGSIYYTANRGLAYGNMVIEHGKINSLTFETEESVLLNIHDQRAVEKNWVMFSKDGVNLSFVYNWYPMVLGKVNENKFEKTHTIETPFIFKHFRGSTHGIVIEDEIWFLCHVVSYEERRYYYHAMVMLDKQTLAFKNYTTLFTFRKEKVEYCLGMEQVGNEIYFGYSIMDKETHYMSIKKTWFDNNRIM